jgi:RNA polymerase sigma-70 factor (ECF subfamily)
MIAEGLALIDKAMRHRRSGPYQIQAAIAALHARAAAGGDRLGADRSALCRWSACSHRRCDVEPRGGGVQGAGAEGLEMIERWREALELFPFLRRARRVLDAARPQRGSPHAFDRATARNTSAEAAHIRMH